MSIARQRRRTADIPVDEAVCRLRLADKLPVPKKRFRLIDMFSGAGGFTLGFTEESGHSFKPIWANDINEYAAAGFTVYVVGVGMYADENYEWAGTVAGAGVVALFAGCARLRRGTRTPDSDAPPRPPRSRSRYGPQVLISPNGAELSYRF